MVLLRLYLEKNDKRFSKLLISKDSSGAIQMGKEIKTSKYMIKIKNFEKDLLNFLLLLDVNWRKIVAYTM